MNATFLLYTQQVDPAYSTGRMQDAICRIYFLERLPAQSTVVEAVCTGGTGPTPVPIPPGALAQADDGNFYLMSLCPDISLRRVKLGFSRNVENRKNNFTTVCPTVQVIKTWPCKFSWEKAVIAMATKDYVAIGEEVFDVASVEEITDKLDKIFSMLP